MAAEGSFGQAVEDLRAAIAEAQVGTVASLWMFICLFAAKLLKHSEWPMRPFLCIVSFPLWHVQNPFANAIELPIDLLIGKDH